MTIRRKWFVSLLTIFVAINITTNQSELMPADLEMVTIERRPVTVVKEPESVVESIATAVAEPVTYYSLEAEYIAKTVWGEARGCTVAEQEQVIWCILNRVDSELQYFPDNIIDVVTQPNQFHGYSPGHPVTDEHYNLALDVLDRWEAEKRGEVVQRNLGKDYVYFHGDGEHNYFRVNF